MPIRVQMNLRLDDGLRLKIQEAADARGISTNKEIVDRLERSFDDQIQAIDNPDVLAMVQLLAAALNLSGQYAGFISTHSMEGAQKWVDDPSAYNQAIQAVSTVLEAMRPEGDVPAISAPPEIAKLFENLGRGFANSIIEEAATGEARATSNVERAKKLHRIAGRLADRLKRGLPRDVVAVPITTGRGAGSQRTKNKTAKS